MKVLLYARVSSERQAEKDLSIASQLKALRKYATDKGWEITKEYVDEAESARTANRPSFIEMIGHAKKHHKDVDAILVWKLSRFARNREDSIVFKSMLRKLDIQVISINESVDDSPSGQLLEAMIEAMDEFYSINLAQDTLRGMRENASRGFKNGGAPPIGYKSIEVIVNGRKKKKLAPDPEFAPIIQRIFRMSLEGEGAKEIASTLNAEGIRTKCGNTWTKHRIQYVLRNEVYIGNLIWNRSKTVNGLVVLKAEAEVIRVIGCHSPIIDNETFDKVQALIDERSPRRSHPKTINSDYVLSGLMFCGHCGAKYVGRSAKSSKHFYYSCINKLNRGKPVCDARMISKKTIENFIVQRIKANILTDENLEELVRLVNLDLRDSHSEIDERIATIEKQLHIVENRLDSLYDTLETGKMDLDDIAPRIKKLRAEMDDLQQTRLELIDTRDSAETQVVHPETVKAYAKDLKATLSAGSIVERRSFLKSFIRRIDVNHPEVRIEYNLPCIKKKAEPRNLEVLPIGVFSSPDWTVIELFSPEKFKEWFETARGTELRELHAMAMA